MIQFGPVTCDLLTGQQVTCDSSILWSTEEFMADSVTARHPDPVAAKKAPNHHTSTTVVDRWCEVFALTCCVWLSPNVALFIIAKQRHWCGLFRRSLAKLHRAATMFLERRSLLLLTLPNKSYLFGVFLIVLS